MIERWTIDSIADEIESQFKGADPQKKLLRRFYNEGKRHGRKGMPAKPMANFLANAVEVATSKITQDFLEAEQQVEASLAAMNARQEMLKEDLGEDGGAGAGTEAGADATGGGSGLGADVGGPDLTGSLARLKAARASREKAAEDARRRGEQEQMAEELEGLGQQLALADQQLEGLSEQYRQMIESCHETGELMWTRYVLGYNLGTAKRGAPDGDDDGPDPDIEFEYPDALDPDQDEPGQNGPSTDDEAVPVTPTVEG